MATTDGSEYRPEARIESFTAVDLFCGCGGVTEGLKQAGFHVVAAVDNDPVACKTYIANHPDVTLYQNDIDDVDPAVIRQNNLEGRDVDLLVVCAPCQPFSNLNREREKVDSRRTLILKAVIFTRVLNPAVIFFENVPGLARNSDIIEQLEVELEELGYQLSRPASVDTADYGVPQRRNRCIMLATRGAVSVELPPPTTPEGHRKTVKDAIGMLSPLQSGEKDPHDTLHIARRHSELNIRRLLFIPPDGGSRFALPEELQLECHKGHTGHPDVYGRMAWNQVAPTLTTGCTDITKGRFAHPEQNRAITMREAALLQTFPLSYKFEGNPTQISRQIGNAVPVEFVKALTPVFRRAIKEVRQHDALYGEAN